MCDYTVRLLAACHLSLVPYGVSWGSWWAGPCGRAPGSYGSDSHAGEVITASNRVQGWITSRSRLHPTPRPIHVPILATQRPPGCSWWNWYGSGLWDCVWLGLHEWMVFFLDELAEVFAHGFLINDRDYIIWSNQSHTTAWRVSVSLIVYWESQTSSPSNRQRFRRTSSSSNGVLRMCRRTTLMGSSSPPLPISVPSSPRATRLEIPASWLSRRNCWCSTYRDGYTGIWGKGHPHRDKHSGQYGGAQLQHAWWRGALRKTGLRRCLLQLLPSLPLPHELPQHHPLSPPQQTWTPQVHRQELRAFQLQTVSIPPCSELRELGL